MRSGTRGLASIIFALLLCPCLSGQAPDPAARPPRLAGIVDLSTLSLLQGASPSRDYAEIEPLDIAAGAEGPVVLFSDRLISLGVHLEMTEQTMQDLFLNPALPPGFVATNLLLGPLSLPVVYSAESGEVLAFSAADQSPWAFATAVTRPIEAVALRRGGLALLHEQSILVVHRRAGEPVRTRIDLPSRFFTAIAADAEHRIWAYDAGRRKISVFAETEKHKYTRVSSITPKIRGAALQFPQIFEVRSDGSFFLGTSGQLCCFEPDGTPRWHLEEFTAGYRQALPAFYRLAVSPDTADHSLYLLDPMGKRLLKFIETDSKADTIDSHLAAAFADSSTDLIRLCLENDLLLQAGTFQRTRSQGRMVSDLERRIKERQARLLAELARHLQEQLRLPEAESAYNHCLTLYRELRSLDPVDPRFPEAVRELSERRNSVRAILVAENPVSIEPVAPPEPPATAAELPLVLKNLFPSTLQQLEVQVRAAELENSLWRGTVDRLYGRDRIVLSLASSAAGRSLLNAEDLLLTLNGVLRFLEKGESKTRYFRVSVLFPAGTLGLP